MGNLIAAEQGGNMTTSRARALLILSFVCLLVTGLFCVAPSWAQEESSSQQPPSNDNAAISEQSREKDSPDADVAAESSSREAPQPPSSGIGLGPLRELGRARAISRQRSPLQWGPLFVNNAGAFFLAGNGLRLDDKTGQIAPGLNTAGIFTSAIVYFHESRRSNFAIQYLPQVVVINGDIQRDLSTNEFSFGTNYLLGRRWSFSLRDYFGYSGRRLVSGDFIVDVDSITGATTNRSFLNQTHRSISDNLEVGLQYAMGARDTIEVLGTFTFLDAPISNQLVTSYDSGGKLSWSRGLSSGQGVGLFYSGERRVFDAVFPNSVYHQVGTSYYAKLSPTLQFRGSIGATRATFGNEGKEWTMTGDLALLKRYGRTLVSLGYRRTSSILPLQTNRFVNRADVAASYQATRYWNIRTAFGYQRAGGTSQDTLNGSYATTQAAYRFSPWLRWLTTFGRVWQPGTTVLPGYSYFSTGIQWQAGQDEPTVAF